MAEWYPPIEPYASGLLDAGDGTAMYWETCGNPACRSCPLDTAWGLARAWPGAELITIADGGHQGNPGERDAYLAALDRFAHR